MYKKKHHDILSETIIRLNLQYSCMAKNQPVHQRPIRPDRPLKPLLCLYLKLKRREEKVPPHKHSLWLANHYKILNIYHSEFSKKLKNFITAVSKCIESRHHHTILNPIMNSAIINTPKFYMNNFSRITLRNKWRNCVESADSTFLIQTSFVSHY